MNSHGNNFIADSGLTAAEKGVPAYDYIVAKNNTGDFNTIADALAAVKARPDLNRRVYIKIRGGVYNESVAVDVKNITFTGDGIGNTIITSSKSVGRGAKPRMNTYETATLAVRAEGFVASKLTVRNLATDYSQGVALATEGNRGAYYKCRFFGYQDTIYVRHETQFFKDCDIYGTIDFICGDAIAVFQDCNILITPPEKDEKTGKYKAGGVITAQKRDDINGPEGFVLQNCTVKAAKNCPPGVKVTLGRPWGIYARVMVMQSFLDGIVDPKGWSEWGGYPERDETACYMEYDNRGPGANTDGRIKWPHIYNKKLTEEDAKPYSVRNFIQGAEWIAQMGVPVNLDL